MPPEVVPTGAPYGVLVIDVAATLRFVRSGHRKRGRPVGESGRVLPPRSVGAGRALELDAADGRRDVGQPEVVADLDVVAVRCPAVVDEPGRPLGDD
jgi:hypothetical protein